MPENANSKSRFPPPLNFQNHTPDTYHFTWCSPSLQGHLKLHCKVSVTGKVSWVLSLVRIKQIMCTGEIRNSWMLLAQSHWDILHHLQQNFFSNASSHKKKARQQLYNHNNYKICNLHIEWVSVNITTFWAVMPCCCPMPWTNILPPFFRVSRSHTVGGLLTPATVGEVHHQAQTFLHWCQQKAPPLSILSNCHFHWTILCIVMASYSVHATINSPFGGEIVQFLLHFSYCIPEQ